MARMSATSGIFSTSPIRASDKLKSFSSLSLACLLACVADSWIHIIRAIANSDLLQRGGAASPVFHSFSSN
jgi:hypothetical protein